jgi:glycosyltransferase involved in cell wall biosynthesis
VSPELVVFSHLPWAFVHQRPQHLISRLARGRCAWFVEEVRAIDGVREPRLRVEARGPVTCVWLEVPGPERFVGFGDAQVTDYGDRVADLLGSDRERTVWMYSPMALPLVERLDRSLLVYDCMDDLASFAHAPAGMRENQDRLLATADLVFTGGRSIDAGVRGRAACPVHLFPSGVEAEHFAPARRPRRERERPVAGYVGVIDERIDLEIVGGLAQRLPHWDIEMVGPIFKISADDVPTAPNLRYPGIQPYERLPEVMAGFDVALMPFALNEATRSISPTKTLEYLAAGLPVVSTRVPDVVADYRAVVDLQDDADGFAAACESVVEHRGEERDERVRPLLHVHHWDTIAARMQALMEAAQDSTTSPARSPAPPAETAA